MLVRTVLTLLLLLPAASSAQDLDAALSAVVRISGTRDDTPVRGSGFVVGLDVDKATIVTASHVIEGVQQLEVTFAADLAERFPAGVVLGMETGSLHGLAVFQVRGQLPAGMTALSVDAEKRPRLGEALFLVGFPEMAQAPRTAQRVLSARSGSLLLVDQKVGEGFSGGPVLQNGKVVGVITDMDEQTTYAVNAATAHTALEGWGVVKPCVPGSTVTMNGIDYVRICSRTFTMGSASTDPFAEKDEQPVRQVTVREFWIGRTEVTNKQYRLFQGKQKGEDDLPVVKITWAEANAACERFEGRLPTEAEWEYAARAGTTTAYSFGDDASKLAEYAWFESNSKYYDDESGHPDHQAGYRKVGKLKPNPWGLYDMHGNAGEWVIDGYDAAKLKQFAGKTLHWKDAIIWPDKMFPTIFKGGHWLAKPQGCRTAVRELSDKEFRWQDPNIPQSVWWYSDAFHVGFRLVRPLKEPSDQEKAEFWDTRTQDIINSMNHGDYKLIQFRSLIDPVQ